MSNVRPTQSPGMSGSHGNSNPELDPWPPPKTGDLWVSRTYSWVIHYFGWRHIYDVIISPSCRTQIWGPHYPWHMSERTCPKFFQLLFLPFLEWNQWGLRRTLVSRATFHQGTTTPWTPLGSIGPFLLGVLSPSTTTPRISTCPRRLRDSARLISPVYRRRATRSGEGLDYMCYYVDRIYGRGLGRCVDVACVMCCTILRVRSLTLSNPWWSVRERTHYVWYFDTYISSTYK
jgi:hypothetical protein